MPLWTINFCHSIVILDELDVLISRCQSLMYNFFDWPNRPSSRTVLIAIANTMDLPERFLTNKISSRLGLHRINFQPYTHTELFSILQAKLATALYDKDALELCTRKVGAVSGDARKALELWTRAIDVSKGRCGDALRVSIEDVHTAIKESYSVDVTSCLHSFSFHQKLFLTSLWKCLRRDSVQQVPFFDVSEMHKQLCRVHSYGVPTDNDLVKIVSKLSSSKIVCVESLQIVHSHLLRFRMTLEEVSKMLHSLDDPFRKLL